LVIKKGDIMNSATGIETGVWDNFSLDCFRNCPQYYWCRIVKGIVKPGARRTPIDFGIIIHSCLEHYYKEGMTDQSIKEALEMAGRDFKEDPADEKHTIGKLLEILGKYFSRYRHEPFNVISTEVGGVVELGKCLYSFRIDLTVEWMNPKGVYGWDHKSTSWPLSSLLPNPNNQITGYDYALKEHYENVVGFMVNGIGVYKETEVMDKNAPKIKGKSGRDVYQKTEKEIFRRIPTTRTPPQLKQWKEETLHLIHQIEECHEKKVWPRFTRFCTAFNSKCMYLDLCQSQDMEIIDPMIASGIYVVDRWEPYKIDGEGGGEIDG
jgi:hypothetical protein